MLLHSLFFFHHPASTEIYTLSLHDALPILAPGPNVVMTWLCRSCPGGLAPGFRLIPRPPLPGPCRPWFSTRSEEHTSELQSHSDLVCRLLLEKKKKNKKWSMERSRRPDP